MKLQFRAFLQSFANGFHTMSVPGVPGCSGYSSNPADLRKQVLGLLGQRLAGLAPGQVRDLHLFHPDQRLERVDLTLRAGGGRRRPAAATAWSALITPLDATRCRLDVPALQDPPLWFLAPDPDDGLRRVPGALAEYLHAHPQAAAHPAEREWLEVHTVDLARLRPPAPPPPPGPPAPEVLGQVGRDLTAQAEQGRLPPAYARDREVQAVLNTLANPGRPCLVLVGESGAGKTAIAREAVRRIQQGNCPDALRGRRVWWTDAGEIVAGQQYTGQWQGRLREIVNEARTHRLILYFEDLVGLAEIGRWSRSDENMALFLKPHVASGDLVLFGEATPGRLRALERLEPGFAALLTPVPVDPAGPAATRQVLQGAARELEGRYQIRIEPDALQGALDLTDRFLPHRAHPGKALAVLDQAAAALRAGSAPPAVLTRPALTRLFAAQTGLPDFILDDFRPLDPAAVAQHFSERILGQPEAVQAVTDLVTIIKAGLNDPHKPLGTFLFIGPTGVGKTELAKALAEYLFGSRERLLRFDMSEYQDASGVDRLVGTPWHRDREGELTGRIRQQSFAVVLLDEIEKAHRSVFDLLLQVLGEGRLTDAAGRTTDFRSAIVILTSNLGAAARERRPLGFQAGPEAFDWEAHFRTEVERFFRPEFVNRLDRIVSFRPLDQEALRRVAQRELGNLLLREGIARRGMLVDLDPAVIDLLLEKGISPEYGARPLKREIERAVILPLARHLVARPPGGPHLVRLRSSGEHVSVESEPLRAPAAQPPGAAARPAPRSLQEAAGALGGLQARLQALAASARVQALAAQRSALLAQTGQPTFWDDPAEARRTLARLYHMDRVVRRLEQLQDRAAHLVEFAAHLLRDQDPRYLDDLARSRDDLDRAVAFLEFECHSDGEGPAALLRVARVSGPGAWAPCLGAAYGLWALAKGYEFRLLLPAAAGWREVAPRETRGALADLAGGKGPPEVLLALRGAGVAAALAGEAGLHLRTERTADGEQRDLARVTVLALAEGEYDLPPPDLGARAAAAPPAEETARIFHLAGERSVRDPRTGARTARVRDVLQGRLDDFLLAWLRRSRDVEA